jgi:hypothetical protein
MKMLDRKSSELSHFSNGPDFLKIKIYNGAPSRSRTCDLTLRRRSLYPLSYGRRNIQKLICIYLLGGFLAPINLLINIVIAMTNTDSIGMGSI